MQEMNSITSTTPSNMDVVKLPHHDKIDVCTTRAKYRQGRKFTAVKVYTINDESQHLIISHVPALGLQGELRKLCSRYGEITSLVFIPSYEDEEFTEAYHIQYARMECARFAKNHMDDKSFFGSCLHVCYAPEMESIDETRIKLIQRRKNVARKTRGVQPGHQKPNLPKQQHRQKKHPALPLTAERIAAAGKNAECIWKGIPCEVDPRIQSSYSKVEKIYGPVKPDEKWVEAGIKERKISLKSESPVPCTSQLNSGTTVRKSSWHPCASSPILKFVPRQVKCAQQVIIKNGSLKQINREESHSVENRSPALGSISVEETILSVRKKIKAVTVPNIKMVLEK